MKYCYQGEHKGKLKFLVMGNSFACNQGNIVYDAFRHLAKDFHVYCLKGKSLKSTHLSKFDLKPWAAVTKLRTDNGMKCYGTCS